MKTASSAHADLMLTAQRRDRSPGFTQPSQSRRASSLAGRKRKAEGTGDSQSSESQGLKYLETSDNCREPPVKQAKEKDPGLTEDNSAGECFVCVFSTRYFDVLKGSWSPPRNDVYGTKCHAGTTFEN